MLLRIDPATRTAERVKGTKLSDFGLDERAFQEVLFSTLDRLVGDAELLLLTQSRRWREEPDLMAVDREANLHIFELKVWEAQQENLLQVLRYGQIYGRRDYDGLDNIWRRTRGDERSLAEAHQAKFDVELPKSHYNRKQVFVVLTNGLDVETREAIRYWKTTGLDVRPWIYRAYREGEKMLAEIVAYRTSDDPLEDQAEGSGSNYYLVNTNISNDERDDADMLAQKKVAAYYAPWKFKIARIKRGDKLLLYRSGHGVVAFGTADGKLLKANYHGDPELHEEEYGMKLNGFTRVDPPMTAAELKAIANNPGLMFRQTMVGLDPESGRRILAQLTEKGTGSRS